MGRLFLAALVGISLWAVDPQTRCCRVSATSGSLLQLNTTDLPFVGYLRVPSGSTDTTASLSGLGGFTAANGHPHILLMGDYANGPPPVYELDINGLTPNPTLASAPRTTLVADHDDFVNGTDVSGGKRNSWKSPGSVAKTRTDSGTTTLIAAAGTTPANDRTITVAVHVSTTFANGDGAQPTLAIGQTGNTTKFAATGAFTNQASGTTLTYSGTLTGGTALIATLTAASGTTSTGAYTIAYGEDQADSTGNGIINGNIYVHNGLWYFPFHINYTDIALWSLYAYDPATGTSCGPWRYTYPSNSPAIIDGTRTHWVMPHPTTGYLLGGGASKSGNASIPWGPSLRGGVDWPTCSTPSGLYAGVSAPTTLPDTYADYYISDGSTYSNLGAVVGTIKQFLFPSNLSYTFQNYTNPGIYADPAQNSGRGTWPSENAVLNPGFWFEGTHKHGALFIGTAPVCPVAADCQSWYRNAQNGWVRLTGTSGTFTGTLTGGTSTATATIMSSVTNTDLYVYFNTNTVDYANGEIVVATGGGTGTVAHFNRNDHSNDGTACVGCASAGPSDTARYTIFCMLDPADLNAVQAGSKTDYTVEASACVDAEATFGFATSTDNTAGNWKTINPGWLDPATHLFYAVANGADCTRVGCGFREAAILVFGPVNDSAPPAPTNIHELWQQALAAQARQRQVPYTVPFSPVLSLALAGLFVSPLGARSLFRSPRGGQVRGLGSLRSDPPPFHL